MKLLNEQDVSPCCDNGVSQNDTTFAKLSVGESPRSECQRGSKGAQDKLGH